MEFSTLASALSGVSDAGGFDKNRMAEPVRYNRKNKKTMIKDKIKNCPSACKQLPPFIPTPTLLNIKMIRDKTIAII